MALSERRSLARASIRRWWWCSDPPGDGCSSTRCGRACRRPRQKLEATSFGSSGVFRRVAVASAHAGAGRRTSSRVAALDPDAPAVERRRCPSRSRTEPGPQRCRVGSLPVVLEEEGQVLVRDPAPRVVDLERAARRHTSLGRGTGSADRAELDGVVEQVLEHLENTVAVAPDRGSLRGVYDDLDRALPARVKA